MEDGQQLNNGGYHNFSINQTLSRNSIDSPIFPTSGAKISLSVQFTPPYSLFRKDNFYKYTDEERQASLDRINEARRLINDSNPDLTFEDALVQETIRNEETARKFKLAEYHKWKFNAEWYSKLFGKLVLKASAKIGMLGAYSKSVGVTPFERYELGGDGIANFNIEGKDIVSLRGYDVGDLSANEPGGATIFDKFTLELRYPISLNPSATIYVLAFAEGGNAWKSFKRI